MKNSNKTWKQAFAEVNALHLKCLKRQEEILMEKLMNQEGSNLFLLHLNFVHNDTYITDQYMDETGRFEVNPIEYYGENYLNALKEKLTNKIRN